MSNYSGKESLVIISDILRIKLGVIFPCLRVKMEEILDSKTRENDSGRI